jgi:DNA-3-methyladenine glycosylase II
MEALTSIKGVGEWTAQMMLMFTYRREDVFPTTDVGIQNAMKAAYQLDVSGKDLKRQMENIAEEWRPYRTLACLYLWNYLLKQKA